MNNIEKVYLAGGCFWGVEYYMQKLDGIVSTRVGFMGGDDKNTTYEDVCNKDTGHAEVVEVEFDSDQVDFEIVAKLFFEIHDSTQLNRQGPDIGNQYRSEIFYTNEKQREISENLMNILHNQGLAVATKLSPAGTFWTADEYHQQYYNKHNKQPYCHKRVKRF